MRFVAFLLLLTAIAGCTDVQGIDRKPAIESLFEKPKPAAMTTMIAFQYLNYGEQTHRAELKQLTGVDPVRTEWCAAFVNAVLRDSNTPGSESVSDYPLLARSFLDWGEKVTGEPQPGDIIVFPRGGSQWQGHVGFYFGTVNVGDITYYKILGGNQNNKVNVELYPAYKALGIRRESPI